MTRAWEENEEVVERFRTWLEQTGREIDDLDATGADDRPDASVRDEPFVEVGLRQLVEAFTAMRHELKLQTKSTRGLDEAVHSALQGLEAAMNRFQSVQAREQEAADGAARPLVEVLAGLDEALHRGARAFEAAHRQMTQSAPDELGRALDETFRRQPWWRRLLMRRWHEFLRRRATETLARCNDREFARVMQGYRLIVTRMQRALAVRAAHGMPGASRRSGRDDRGRVGRRSRGRSRDGRRGGASGLPVARQGDPLRRGPRGGQPRGERRLARRR